MSKSYLSDIIRNQTVFNSAVQQMASNALALIESVQVPYLAMSWVEQMQPAVNATSLAHQAQWLATIPDMLSTLEETQSAALSQVTDVFATQNRMIDSFVDIELLSQQIMKMAGSLDDWTRQISIGLSSLVTTLISSIPTDIFADLAAQVHYHQDVVMAFQSAGWPIAPSMPPELLERVVEHYKQGKKRHISQTIIGHYQRNRNEALIATVEAWEKHPLFAPRMHILRDALQAHCDGKYTLSIPAIFPQIEGILSDYVSINNLPARLGSPKEVSEKAIGDLNDYNLWGWIIASTLLHQLMTNTYVHTSFVVELKRSGHRRSMTRHTVLHGISPNYDRPIHSLKGFLLLDAVSALCEKDDSD